MKKGIDVSKYDPPIDWANYTWDFVFIKASEGTVEDRMFRQHWTSSRYRALRGPYHYFRPFVDPKLAAQKLVEILGNDIGELPPILDFETYDGTPDTQQRALTWLREIERLVGIKPIVYTSPGFANLMKLSLYSDFSNYKLWSATYPWDEITYLWTEVMRTKRIKDIIDGTFTYVFPPLYAPFRKMSFVQWTAKCPPNFVPGYPLGIKLAVDVNFYKGNTIEDLMLEFGITSLPKPPEEGEHPMPTVTLLADLMPDQPSNLRTGPGLSAAIRRQMKGPLTIQGIGQKVIVDGFHWIEIIVPEPGWVALTTSYTNLRWIPETTPVPVTKKATSIEITNPEKIIITWDDGTTQSFP